ncbi:acyl-CoA dehydrogenase family protein [Qipengyuania sp. ASV99]|uniref:acyl-CoA dehydrogenase family protein n=1 Tax=Qipengyuania sp. ASV99 TaxID=3399681 RepID=UPI003A4C51F1
MERETLSLIAEGLERILADAPLEAIDQAAGQGADARALWSTLAENGFVLLCAAEEHGGFGGSIADALVLGEMMARHAAALPLGDTMLAAGLLSAAGCEAPELRIGLVDPFDSAAAVAHAAQVDAVLILQDGFLRCARLSPDDFAPLAKAEDGAGRLVRAPQETLAEIAAPDWLSADAFRAIAALMRAANMAGAMQAVLELTLTYTQEREQFGRPLAKFQAIQHHLSDIACETAASIAAVELASDALRIDPHCGPGVLGEIAIAKTRCGQAASKVAAAAHQAHGAMGFTREYALGRFTRRLWQWQDEFGSQTEWASRLGRSVLSDPEPRLWPRISQPI